jgi:hypothetical protein
MAFAPWRTGPLHRYGEHHLAYRRTIGGTGYATRLIDELDQVQLLGDPYQSPDVTDSPRTNRARQCQVGYRRRIGWTQHRLACERPLLGGIPQRLRSHPISRATHLALTYFILSSRKIRMEKSNERCGLRGAKAWRVVPNPSKMRKSS